MNRDIVLANSVCASIGKLATGTKDECHRINFHFLRGVLYGLHIGFNSTCVPTLWSFPFVEKMTEIVMNGSKCEKVGL